MSTTDQQTSTDRSSASDSSETTWPQGSASSGEENLTLCMHRVKRSATERNNINTVNAVNLKLPTSVNVSVGGCEFAALLDGGSATTLMRASFARSKRLKWTPLNTTKKQWVGADGGKLNVVGSCQTEVTIGNTKMKMNSYVVENIIHNLVIGTHFMLANKCIVNYMDKTLRIGNDRIAIEVEDADMVCSAVAITIPAKSEIRASFKSESKNGVVMLESRRNRVFNIREGLCKTDENGLFDMVLLNGTDYPVSIKQGDSICSAISCEVLGELDASAIEKVDENKSNSTNGWEPGEEANIDTVHLRPDEVMAIKKVLNNHAAAFSRNDLDIGRTEIEHHIELSNSQPFKSRAYRIPTSQVKIVDEHVNEMLSSGVIRPSSSNYSSPIVLVKKADGSIRFCVDYRKLNALTLKDHYPVPLIEERIASVIGSTVFSDLDLTSGYWQFALTESSQKLTAFICHLGLFEFIRMPFGLCNAGATFQREMERLLNGLKFAIAYIDDILVHSATVEDHLKHLDEVLSSLEKSKLKIKLRKCHFGYREARFLGYNVSGVGVRMRDEKIRSITEYPEPQSAKQARKLNGLTSYYRNYIESYGTINEPIQKAAQMTTKDFATKKRINVQFKWTEDCRRAFETIKKCLVSAPILVHPNTDKPFRLITDASAVGLGAVLVQLDEGGAEKVISYASRTLNETERRYSTPERELLAVRWAVRKFRCYLYGTIFEVYTDHRPLTHIKTSKNPSPRMYKWILELEEYNATYYYRPGKINIVPDVLSRVAEKVEDEKLSWYEREKPIVQLESEQAKGASMVMSDSEIEPVLSLQVNVEQDEVSKEMVTKAQADDAHLQQMVARKSVRDKIVRDPDGTLFLVNNGGGWRLIIPKEPHTIREHILRSCHNDLGGSHLGRTKTLDKVAKRFFWMGLGVDVANWVRCCEVCSKLKTDTRKTEPCMTPLPVVFNPFDRIAIDFVGPCPVTARGNKHVLVFIDYATRWPEAFATKDQKAETVAEIFVNEILCRHGAPVELLSDRGRNFLAEVVMEVWRFTRTRKVYTTSYHPQTNGLCEKFNGTLFQMLAAYTDSNQRNWYLHLPMALFGYRTAVQRSTNTTPGELLYARQMRLPMDVELFTPKLHFPLTIKNEWRRAQECVQNVAKVNKAAHDGRNKPTEYAVGDMVRVKCHTTPVGLTRKLQRERWSVPYQVTEVSQNNLTVLVKGKPKVLNKMHVKKSAGEFHWS